MSTLLTLAKADTGPLVVTVSHLTMGATGLLPYHSGSGKLWFYGKLDPSDPDTPAVAGGAGAYNIKKDLITGVSVSVDGNNTTTDGVVNITLLPADTTSLPADRAVTYYCSLKGFDGTNEYTIVRDVLLLVTPYATSKVS
jgi:hypothetical protein